MRALNVGGLALSADEAKALFAPFVTPPDGEVRRAAGCSARRAALARARACPPLTTLSRAQLNYLQLCAAFNDTLPPGFLEALPAGAEEAAAAASAGASALAVSPVLGGSAGAFVPLSAAERRELDEVLARVRRTVTTRGLDMKLYLRDHDASHRGLCTATRFARVLSSTLPLLAPCDLALLCKAYATADGVDVRYLVFHNDVSVPEDAAAGHPAAAAAAAWPRYGEAAEAAAPPAAARSA